MGALSLSAPYIGEREVELVTQVLRTDRLSMGPMLERFEAAVAGFVGVRHAAAVSSGTAGLHLAVVAAGVGHGDGVITTPFSFVASANCILYEGGTPIFVDIDPLTRNLDPAGVTQAVADLEAGGAAARRWLPPTFRRQRAAPCRPKALLPVHVFGHPCAMDRLMAIAEAHGLRVIEDACEALGATFQGRSVGAFGDCGVFAFYPNKQITTGEGGILVTDDDEWARLFRSLRNQGRDDDVAWLRHTRLGYNYRLDELSAALGVAQMERIDELLARREQVARWYTERLVEIDGIQAPSVGPGVTRMSWFVYVVQLAPEVERDGVMEKLAERGVPTRPYFTPLHLQPFYRQRFGYREGMFPVAERVASSTLALPFSGRMTEAQVERVCRVAKEVL